MPAHRAGATLARTLDALLHDNGDVVADVVVVITGDDDGAGAAACRARTRVVRSEMRRSAGAARNLGRGHAAGARWLLFVDADCAPAPGAVALLLAAACDGGEAAVAAAVAREGGGLVPWLRHLLEFKDAERGDAVASATLLCRADAFDAAGGFPDMWPGEDLVLRERLIAAGARVACVAPAVTKHLHPRATRAFLAHQYRLGRTSAAARAITPMLGDRFVRHAGLVPLLALGRAARVLAWLVRHDARRLPLFILASPLYLAGLMSWTIGFARAARQCA